MKINLILFLFVTGISWNTLAQTDNNNPHGLNIVSDIKIYDSLVKSDSSRRMVDLETFIPGIDLEIRYATENNFTHLQVYSDPRAFVRLPVGKALRQIEKELNSKGLGLKVLDAYRPYAATLLFWDLIKDTLFVAAPWRGSRHNRGCAVDVTLIDLKTGKELNMPTPFDDFSKKAGATYMDLPPEVIQNRKILADVMQKYGFTVYPEEWWHFDFQGWKGYELMDIPFNLFPAVF